MATYGHSHLADNNGKYRLLPTYNANFVNVVAAAATSLTQICFLESATAGPTASVRVSVRPSASVCVERLTLVVVRQLWMQLQLLRLIIRFPLLQYVGDIIVGLIRQKSVKKYEYPKVPCMSIFSIDVPVPVPSQQKQQQQQQQRQQQKQGCITHIYESSFSASSMSRISMSSNGRNFILSLKH